MVTSNVIYFSIKKYKTMTDQNFKAVFLVDQSPSEVFNAVLNPRAWWSEEIEGGTSKVGDIFDYHFEDIHRSKMKLMQVVPDQKVVWRVLDNYFKPGIFDEAGGRQEKKDAPVHEQAEWVETKIIFEISREKGKTRLQFTHDGLVPDYECYNVCENAWGHYIKESLYSLITTGEGQPNKSGRPMTIHEEELGGR